MWVWYMMYCNLKRNNGLKSGSGVLCNIGHRSVIQSFCHFTNSTAVILPLWANRISRNLGLKYVCADIIYCTAPLNPTSLCHTLYKRGFQQRLTHYLTSSCAPTFCLYGNNIQQSFNSQEHFDIFYLGSWHMFEYDSNSGATNMFL